METSMLNPSLRSSSNGAASMRFESVYPSFFSRIFFMTLSG